MKKVILLLIVSFVSFHLKAKDYKVKPHGQYTTIGDVRPYLHSGDRVLVAAGTYYEHIYLVDNVSYILDAGARIVYGGNDGFATVSDSGRYVRAYIGGGSIERTDANAPAIEISGGSSLVISSYVNGHQGVGMLVSRGSIQATNSIISSDSNYALDMEGTSDTSSVFIQANGTFHSAGTTAVYNNGGSFMSSAAVSSSGKFGYEQNNGVAHLASCTISSSANGGYGTGDAINIHGGRDLYLDNVTMTCANSGAYCLSEQGSPYTVYILSTCHSNREPSPLVIIVGGTIIP